MTNKVKYDLLAFFMRSAIQPIADAAHGFDVGRPRAELPPERDKHHVDKAVRDVLGLGLDGVKDGGAGVDAVLTGKEGPRRGQSSLFPGWYPSAPVR